MFKSELKRELARAEKNVSYYIKSNNEAYGQLDKINRKYRAALEELAGIAGITEQYTKESGYDDTYFDVDLLVTDLLKSAKDTRKYTEMEDREIRLMGGIDFVGTTESN